MGTSMETEFHIKRLTDEGTFFRYHVHLDARDKVCLEGVKLLEKSGFSRASISINCFSFAQSQNRGAKALERMFESANPETWTLKTNNLFEARRGFRIASSILPLFDLGGYAEMETVHSDRPILAASKPFNESFFERLCPPVRRQEKNTLTFLDAAGVLRRLPFLIETRPLDSARGEAGPVLEFHLSLNYNMLTNLNLACLLHGMGLASYELSKILARQDGTIIHQPNGTPFMIRERPLTLRLAGPGSEKCGRASWKQVRNNFLATAAYIYGLVEKLGGFSVPMHFSEHELLYPVTFKLESLGGFSTRVASNEQLPEVFDRFISENNGNELDHSFSLLSFRDSLERRWMTR